MVNKKFMAILMGTVIGTMAMTGCGNSSKSQSAATTTVAATQAQSEESKATEETTAVAEAVDPADEKMVDVGGDFPVSTKYAEAQLVDYYIAEFDETPTMVVARTADGKEYQTHFYFYGDEQLVEFTVDGDKPKVTQDKTGFMAKDIDNIYAAIQKSDNWKPVA